MARERVTVFPGVPTMFVLLSRVAAFAGANLPSLRIVTNTAAALPVGRILELRNRFPGVAMFSMYGPTECVEPLSCPQTRSICGRAASAARFRIPRSG